MEARGRTAACYGLTGVLNALWGATLPANALTVAAVALGVMSGALNVALSPQAVAVEQATDRPVMATMHGTWTLGAVAGGALVTAGLHAGIHVQALLLTGAAALLLTMLSLTRRLPQLPVVVRRTVEAEPRWSGLAVALGVVGAAAFVSEGAATDWAGVHATRVLGASTAVGSLVYTAFFVAMTVVRFVGDPVRARLGPALTIRLAGLTATAGYTLVLLIPSINAAIAGWVLVGVGMAMVWPVVVSELGSQGASARRLSTVTAISYGGGLVGPALIGTVAGRATLPIALLIPAALAVLVAVAAPAVLTLSTTTRSIR